MRKFYTFCILLLCFVVFPNLKSKAANYWKDYGSTFVLNHPWLKVEEYAISSDSKILNIKTQSDSLYQLDMETGEILKSFVPTISKISKDWKFSEDGDYVIFADMITWDEASYKHLLDFKFYSQKIDKSNHIDSLQYKLENKKYLFANTPGGYKGSDLIYKFDPTRHLFFINLAEHIELSHLPYPMYYAEGPCVRGFNVVFKLDSQKFEISDHFYMDGYKINETYDKQNMKYLYSGTNAFNAINDEKPYPYYERYQFEYTFQYEIDLRTFKLVKNKHVEDSSKFHIVSVYNDSIDYAFRAGHKLKIDQTDLPLQISKYRNNQKIDSIEFNYNNHNSFFPLAQNLLLTKIQNQLYVFDLNEFVIIDSISFPYNDNYKFANQKLIFFNGANIYKMNFKYYSTNTLVEILPNESTFTNQDSLNIRFVSNQNIKDFTWEIEKNEINKKSFKYRFLTKGNYTISLRYTFDGINYQTITKSVLITEKIITDFTINKKRYSIDEEVEFTNKSIGDKLKYRWDFGDRAISADVNPTHAYSEPGYYTVKLVAFDMYFRDSIVKQEIVNCEFPEKVKAVSVSFSDSLEIAKKLINTIADTSRQDYRLSYIFCSDLIGSAFYVNYDESYWYYNDCIRLNGYARTYNYGIAYKNGMRYPIQYESNAMRLDNENYFYTKIGNRSRLNILADSASKVFDKNSKDSIWVYNKIKSTFDLPSEYGIRHLLKNSFIWAKYNSYNTIEGIYEYDFSTQQYEWLTNFSSYDYLLYKNELVESSSFNSRTKASNVTVYKIDGSNKSLLELPMSKYKFIDKILMNQGSLFVFCHDSTSAIVYKLDNNANEIAKARILNFKKLNFAYNFNKSIVVSGEKNGDDACIILDSNLNIKKYLYLEGKSKSFYFFIKADTQKNVKEKYKKGTCKEFLYYEYNKLEVDLSEFTKRDSVITEIEMSKPINNSIIIYPNPAQDQLYIQNISPGKMQIMDILGQVVMEFEIKEEEISKLLDISSLPSGVYLLQSGRTVQKFVKE